MTAFSIQPTFPIFTDIDGQPLEAGYIWIGAANLNPLTNPISVYWNAALTQPAAQPIRTIGGYPVNAGTPARLYVNSDYSIQVQNRNGSVVYSAPAATERYANDVIEITFSDVTGTLGLDRTTGQLSSSRVDFLQSGTSAVTRTAQSKMRDVVSVKDFGAIGNGIADDRAAIQLAVNAASAAGGGRVHLPAGSYKVGSALTVPTYVSLVGDGAKVTTILRAFVGDFISLGGYCGIEELTIDGQTSTYGNGRGVVMTGSTPNSYMLLAEIINFSQACLEFGTGAGSLFRALGCVFYTTGTPGSVAAVRVNGTDASATSRNFTNCESNGCTLYDFGGSNDFYVTGGYSNGLIFGSTSSKVLITNVRIGASAGTVTIQGASHRLSTCAFAVPVVLSCSNTSFYCEVPSYNITDNGTGNDVYIGTINYTPVFAASGGGASVGNGTLSGRWSRQGTKVHFQIDLFFGSTTAVGTGNFTFTLPVTDFGSGAVQLMGTGYAMNAAGTSACVFAVRQNAPGDGKITCLFADTTGTPQVVGAAKPTATWGSGSTIRLSGIYYVT